MNRIDQGEFDDASERLDAGLRAAFGPTGDEGSWEHCDSIVSTFDQTLGIHSRISLRDNSDGGGPMLRPQSAEIEDGEGRIGRYQLAGEIARGGVGVILRGRDADLGRDVAIKSLLGRHAANPLMVQRFLEEAQITGQLQHPGILPVYELGLRKGERPYFSMKLVKGRTLGVLLRDRSDAHEDRRRFLNVFEQICQTMAYAHSRGVVHRDLKPSNIMVGPFGEVQIVDWGLAKVLARGTGETPPSRGHESDPVVETIRSEGDGSQSIAGSIMGTPAYMSPEQARGETDRIDERTDVFALGGMLCEILTGEPPYVGNHQGVLEQAASCDLDHARKRLDACDADVELRSLALRCMSKHPKDRPHTASAVADSMAAYLASLEDKVRAAEIAAAEAEVRAVAARRSRRLTLALATSLLFAILLIGGGLLWRDQVHQQRVSEGAQLIGAALERAATLFGQAKASAVGDRTPWEAALAAGDHLEQLVLRGPVDDDTLRRANGFLDALHTADAERRLLELTQEIVSRGATHSDVESWKRMDDEYVTAFLDAGVDVRDAGNEAIADWIRGGDRPEELANAFELWVWTGEDLKQRFGVDRYPQSLRERAEPIFLADDDAFRSRLREQMYRLTPEGNTIDMDELRQLAADPAFETATPTSLSWLGSCFFASRNPDPKAGIDVYRRAVAMHPDDFMLNSDYARVLEFGGRNGEASRILSRCVAVRPDVSGTWRSLGIVLRKLERYDESIEALRQSIKLQPEHVPTYVDLWLAQVAYGEIDRANETLDRAKTLAGPSVESHVMLMQALPDRSPMTSSGKLEEAIGVLKGALQEQANDASATALLTSWIAACERAIEYREATLPDVPGWVQPASTDD